MPDAESKDWHCHPVWFLDGNLIVGYSKLTHCLRLMFWSGQSFKTKGLAKDGSFKAAEARYTSVHHVDVPLLTRWLEESRAIQWEYKDIVRRRGTLIRIQ